MGDAIDTARRTDLGTAEPFIISLGSVGDTLYGIDLNTDSLIGINSDTGDAFVVGAVGVVAAEERSGFSGFAALTGVDTDNDGEFDSLYGNVNFDEGDRLGGVAVFDLATGKWEIVGTNPGVIFFGFGASPAPRYRVIDLGTLGGPQSFANAINENREVTGNSSPTSTTFPLQAYRWVTGRMISLGTLPGAANDFSRGFGINDAGVIVGESGNGPSFAFRADNGILTQLPSLNADGTGVANGINNGGQIVGQSSNGQKVRPFLIDANGIIHDLGTLAGGTNTSGFAFGINEHGDAVGFSNTSTDFSTPSQATLWEQNPDGTFHLTNLGSLVNNTQFSQAFAINDDQVVVGVSTDENSTDQAFLWQDGAMRGLGKLGDFAHSRAEDNNNAGQVVGFASTFSNFPSFGGAACLWQNGLMMNLNGLIPPDSGWELLSANGINEHGDIVGFGRLKGSPSRAFLLVQPTLTGTDKDDVLVGTRGNDVIVGGAGNDTIKGGSGNDIIFGDEGDDNITTDRGDDLIDAGDGRNTIQAGAGDNVVTADAGDDNIRTGRGDDLIDAGDGRNTIQAGAGDNVVMAGAGDDNITTGRGDDLIDAGGGTDTIEAGSGTDTCENGERTRGCEF